jgi:uncharacterized membrane protein YbhN (UPF0104 family)
MPQHYRKNAFRLIVMSITIPALLVAVIRLNPGLHLSFENLSEQAEDAPPQLIAVVVFLKIIQTIASTLSWRNILRAVFPDEPITFKRVFTIEQGKDAMNLVLPAKPGTWGMLSAFRLSIPGAQMPAILAAWGAQSLGFVVLGFVNTAIAAYLLPGTLAQHQGATSRIARIISQQPLLAVGAIAILVPAILLGITKSRARIVRIKRQFVEGIAIFRSPKRYATAVLLPVSISYACRYGMSIAVMSAFGLPITPSTVALALTSHQLAGAIRVTPGGFGTTQAVDLLALHTLASSSAITAYSVTQGVLMTSLTLVSGAIAVLWTINMRSVARLIPVRSERN